VLGTFASAVGTHALREKREITMDQRPQLSILMPVYNELTRVEQALDQVLAADFSFSVELIVVDDGSTDGTASVLDRYPWPPHSRLLRHSANQGKGAAVQTALSHARGVYSAIFDADLEYDPMDLEVLLAPLHRGDANAAFGVRAFDGFSSHSFLFVMGNRAVTLVANILFNVYLHDIMTCHKAIRTDVFRDLDLGERGFTIEPEIAARLIQRGERIYEVPVHYRARASDEGKKLTVRDGFGVVRTLVRCRLSGHTDVSSCSESARVATSHPLPRPVRSHPPAVVSDLPRST
jgi:glycosyltransferase involved in cell wall biosynthesis